MAAPAIACDFATEHFIAIGNTGGVGPDVWQAGHSGSLVNLQNTTFSLFTGASQCYPSDCFATNPGRSGADEANNSLGYALFGDNVYDFLCSNGIAYGEFHSLRSPSYRRRELYIPRCRAARLLPEG